MPSYPAPALMVSAVLLLSATGLTGCVGAASQTPAAPVETETIPEDAASTDADDSATTEDCAFLDVVVTEPNSTTTFTGECGSITIQTLDATVSFESAHSLTVMGQGATVTASGKVGAASIDGQGNSVEFADVESIAVSGDSNSVTADRAGSISVLGADNTVNWRDGASDAEVLGSGNTTSGPND